MSEPEQDWRAKFGRADRQVFDQLDPRALTAEEIRLLDESAAGLDVDAECYQSWKPPSDRVEQ